MKKSLLTLLFGFIIFSLIIKPIKAQNTISDSTKVLVSSFSGGELELQVFGAKDKIFFLFNLLGSKIAQQKIFYYNVKLFFTGIDSGVYFYVISSDDVSDKNRKVGYLKVR